MNISGPLWIGSTVDVRTGQAAVRSLRETSDEKYWTTLGIIRVDEQRWQTAQRYERDCWMKYARSASDDRHEEHRRNFSNYDILKKDLGDVIEIGCGPFTQFLSISGGRTYKSITLLDPLLNDYVQHPKSTYHTFHDKTMLAIPAEDLNHKEIYDTAICINVLEHVQDAVLVLQNLRSCLKPGGILVFHERSWDDIDVSNVYDAGHPIRPSKKFLDSFRLRFFNVYENGDYFIGRKR